MVVFVVLDDIVEFVGVEWGLFWGGEIDDVLGLDVFEDICLIVVVVLVDLSVEGIGCEMLKFVE